MHRRRHSWRPGGSARTRRCGLRGRDGAHAAISQTTGTGDTKQGCKFLLLDRARNLTCCYSALVRGEKLCDPAMQSSGCRVRADTSSPARGGWRVAEPAGRCVLTLPSIGAGDAGSYRVIFPGQLADNDKFTVKLLPTGQKSASVMLWEVFVSITIVVLVAVVSFFMAKRPTWATGHWAAGQLCLPKN